MNLLSRPVNSRREYKPLSKLSKIKDGTVHMHSLSTVLFLLERKEERNMLDIKFVRENPEKVKENIKKKFQD